MLQSAYNSNALTIANEVQLSQLIGAGMIIVIEIRAAVCKINQAFLAKPMLCNAQICQFWYVPVEINF